jgi:AAA15 family ATPase/GTPase
MLDSITIKNFKAIGNDGLTLNGLTNVNYLVGKNGCGKSSVLENIEYKSGKNPDYELMLTQRMHNFIDKFIGQNIPERFKSKVNQRLLEFAESDTTGFGQRFRYDKNDKIWFHKIYYGKNIAKPTTSFKFNFHTFAEISKGIKWKEGGYKPWGPVTKEPELTNAVYSDFEEKSQPDVLIYQLLYFGQIEKEFDIEIKAFNPIQDYKKIPNFTYDIKQEERNEIIEILKGIGNFVPPHNHSFITNGALIFGKDRHNEENINFSELSSGQKVILELFYLFKTKLKDVNTILIDEPETSLHPEVQKMLPKLFASFPNIQFFVATHSPFIISAAAKEENQKVYLIEDGQTVDIDGYKNNLQSQLGYDGGDCLLAVNKMLGSDIQDIAPHVIIFCEKTLKILLEQYKSSKPLILTEKAGGQDDRIKAMTEIFDSIRKSDSVNLLNYNIYGVIDICGKEAEWKIQLKDKLIVLNDDELEKLYAIDLVNSFLSFKGLPEWDKVSEPNFAKEYCKKISYDKGDLKCEMAEYIGQNTTKEFVKLISIELYNLIFD